MLQIEAYRSISHLPFRLCLPSESSIPTAKLHLTTFYLESSFSVKYLNQN